MAENLALRQARFRGCLLGLAVGDALGAPVEFWDLPRIRLKYGMAGIQDFDSWGSYPEFAAGSYTDDTQMSLATARGLIKAVERWRRTERFIPATDVYQEYLAWRKAQTDPVKRRLPGATCLTALEDGNPGTVDEPLNDSKGAGGVMRVAPAGLVFPPADAFREAMAYAALTHGHPSGFLPAGLLAETIARIMRDSSPRVAALHSLTALGDFYPASEETQLKVRQALEASETSQHEESVILDLGEGWVGEEALAIALYCAIRHADDFRAGVLAAVNITGDSDTTGSITGAILGALLGEEGIPAEWRSGVENAGLIGQTADELEEAFRPGRRLPFAAPR
jgi:ADP-ribosylglycohydrolase